jgi:hypothetical protein
MAAAGVAAETSPAMVGFRKYQVRPIEIIIPAFDFFACVEGVGQVGIEIRHPFNSTFKWEMPKSFASPTTTSLEHFSYFCELSKFNAVQLFLTEKLRRHRRFGLYL